MYSTDNKDIQKAVERHCNFGKRFRLEKAVEKKEVETVVAPVTKNVKRVKVSDIATAKDYLANACGISRTVLRSEKSIMEQAEANGIEFYGMNGDE